jgi:3-oxoacyl-[acyl-carrier protein] reductase
MDFGLKGKTVLVTASSSGIGKAVAELFAAEGCNVAICSRNDKALSIAAADIENKYKVHPFWHVCDLNKKEDIETTVNAVVKEYSSIDILVNNCGGPVPGFLKDLTEQNWQDAFEQVLLSVVKFCNLIVPGMIEKKWGRVINLTSLTVKQPIDNLMLSNSLRTGIIGFAKSLSNEVAKYNITVNNIATGYTLTNRLYELASERAKRKGITQEQVFTEMVNNVPMNRLASPEEIASVVVFLASNQVGYLTGNTIHVDGGAVKGLF